MRSHFDSVLVMTVTWAGILWITIPIFNAILNNFWTVVLFLAVVAVSMTPTTIALVQHDEEITNREEQDDTYFNAIILFFCLAWVASIACASSLIANDWGKAISLMIAALVCNLITWKLLKLSSARCKLRADKVRKKKPPPISKPKRTALDIAYAEVHENFLARSRRMEKYLDLSEHCSKVEREENEPLKKRYKEEIAERINVSISQTNERQPMPVISWDGNPLHAVIVHIYRGWEPIDYLPHHRAPGLSRTHKVVTSSMSTQGGSITDDTYTPGTKVYYFIFWEARVEVTDPYLKVHGRERKELTLEDVEKGTVMTGRKKRFDTIFGEPIVVQKEIDKYLTDLEAEEAEIEILEKKARLAKRRADLPKEKEPYRSPQEKMSSVLDDVMSHFEQEQDFDQSYIKACQAIFARTDWDEERKQEARERLDRMVQDLKPESRS